MQISIHGLTGIATNAIIVTIVLSLFFIFVGWKIRKADPTQPSRGVVFIFEMIYHFIENALHAQIGALANKYVAFIMTVGAYLAVANLVGLVGLIPPTSNVNINAGLAVVSLLYLMGAGISAKGIGRYLKDVYIGPAASAPFGIKQLIIVINIVSELGKLVSLSMRLFGNMASGALLLALVSELVAFMFGLVPVGTIFGGLMNISLIPFLNAYFDIFAGLMQTMIFCILMMMWLKTAVVREQES